MAESGILSFGAHRSRNQRRAIELFQTARAVQTTTSSTYATVTNATKAVVWGGGKVIIIVNLSHEVTGSVGTVVDYQLIRTDTSAVLAGGAVWKYSFNSLDRMASGYVELVDLPRGAYTIALQWRRASGGGTVSSGTGDYMQGVIIPVF
jgi:hypothetical protein